MRIVLRFLVRLRKVLNLRNVLRVQLEGTDLLDDQPPKAELLLRLHWQAQTQLRIRILLTGPIARPLHQIPPILEILFRHCIKLRVDELQLPDGVR